MIEDEFFQRISTVGTMISSALEVELDIINKQYHPNSWNIYTFYAGDGENWQADNKNTISLLSALKEVNQMVVYTEINPNRTHPDEQNDVPNWAGPTFTAWKEDDGDSIWTMCVPLVDHKFKRLLLTKSDQIWASFKQIFGIKT